MAYVENLLPYSVLKDETALIRPTVPIEISSSLSSSELLYFLATCATRRIL